MRAPFRFALRQLRARPLACFAVAFLLGLLVEKRWPMPAAICACALVALAGLCFALRGRPRALMALGLLVGVAAGLTRMAVALEGIPSVETRYSVEMVGRVASEPFTHPKTGRRICKFSLESADGEPSALKLRLYLRDEDADALESIAYGQRLRLKGHIWAADPVTNPYEFDFGDYLNRQGLAAYATAKLEDVEILDTIRDLRSAVVDVRQAIARRIDALFPDSAGLMRALVLGDRSLLGDELRDALSRTGTTHLICISGMHVTLLAAVMALVLSRFLPPRWANLVAALLLIPYGALIGFTAPFVRALVMFLLFCLLPWVGRLRDSLTSLGVALLIWLAISPLSVGDAGFTLSFAASAGIILLMPTLTKAVGIDAVYARRLRTPHKSLRRYVRRAQLYLPTVLCASLAAQLATLPYVIACYGAQSVVSLAFNLVCVPLCMVAYVLGAAALLVSALSLPAGMLLARVPNALFACLTAITAYGAGLPVATVRVGRYSAPLLALHWGVALSASALSRIPIKRRWLLIPAMLGVACLSTALSWASAWPFGVTFLDAGQGDCAVLRTHGRTYLFDAGDTYTPAADYLNATCLRLDGVVLSHPHKDHAGGLSEVLDSFTPGVIYVPKGWFDVEEVAPEVTEGIERARAMGVGIRELAAGDVVSLSDAATLEVLSPDGLALPDEVNDLSMLALVACDGQRALFTGDLSVGAEPEAIPDTDLLKVAHHGSSKATSERFLAACTPSIAVISVGENNYGHPSPETVGRLRDSGAAVYQTLTSGAITLTWTGREWRIETYLEATDELE